MAVDNWPTDIKVVIFDMDGTLYQEDTFMERYIRYLLEETEHEADTEAAVSMGKAIRSGEQTFGFGHFYHLKDDLLVIRLEDGLARGYAWDGSSVPVRKKLYKFDSILAADLLHIGDPWNIVAMLSHRYKLPETKLSKAFDRVRKEMLAAPYQFEIHSGLMQAIEKLNVDKKVLMTNTHLESGAQFLDFMQIHFCFDEVYCDAGKPARLTTYLASLLQQGYKAHEILSVGDNPWNDLHPVKRIGGRTCFISPYPSHDPEVWDLRLTTLDELEQLMCAIGKQQMKEEMKDGTNPAEGNLQEIQG
ncbi:MAG: HAD hydrolase-like protein [Paenibacillus sp.]|nr:HAD hydrolase-like protein [Paenibacillus sp.]